MIGRAASRCSVKLTRLRVSLQLRLKFSAEVDASHKHASVLGMMIKRGVDSLEKEHFGHAALGYTNRHDGLMRKNDI